MSKQIITLTVNGDRYEVASDPWRTLAEVLREDLRLTGTKIGCGHGDCGACTVLLDGRTVASCLTLAVEAQGHDVTTIEAGAEKPDRIQAALVARGAVQCGFCSPGMVLSARTLLASNPHPTEDEVRRALAGNLCRCTGYTKIVEAVLAAADPSRDSVGRQPGGVQ